MLCCEITETCVIPSTFSLRFLFRTHLGMAMSEHHQFHNYLQQSKPFRDVLNNMDAQIAAPVSYINANHPPYIPQFHVVGFAPGTDVSDGGFELKRNYDLELRNKRPKEQEFFENNNVNSQISSIDFLQQ
ncbi:uncharacterized protein LOC118483867 [Helianthus annuus]|uniref:uncharacterized protein LOC118483867 n=1 Tax=Helianthus annuus TaxID=4232 RepID=UPI001652ECE0|nr:uncharacterized protein LOC118483867 [Helianthus annuus]